ncbi:MAG: phosphatase PAP2 family protein [Actinomycetota bacterium]
MAGHGSTLRGLSSSPHTGPEPDRDDNPRGDNNPEGGDADRRESDGDRGPAAQFVARFDDAVDGLFTGLRGSPTADRIFYLASEGADYSRAWHAIGLVMALVSPSRRPDAVRLAIALGVESAIVNGVLKNVVPRERPPLLDDRAYDVRRPKTKSFPSGHASSATMTAVLLSDALPKLKPVWWGLAAVVSASRVHNRMHHGSDVAAGAIIGTAMGVLTKRIRPLR